MWKQFFTPFIRKYIIVFALGISLGLLIALASGRVMFIDPFIATVIAHFLVLAVPGWLLVSLIEPSAQWAEKIGIAGVLSVGLWSIPGLFLILFHSNMSAMLITIMIITTLILGGYFGEARCCFICNVISKKYNTKTPIMSLLKILKFQKPIRYFSHLVGVFMTISEEFYVIFDNFALLLHGTIGKMTLFQWSQ